MFIGEKEVSSIDGTIVTFVDGTTETYTNTNLAYLQTEESKDATAFQELFVENVSKALIEYIKTVDNFDNSNENIDKIKEGMINLFVEHDVRIGNPLTDGSFDLEKILRKVFGLYTTAVGDAMKGVGFTIRDTTLDCMAITFGTYTKYNIPAERMRNIRFSDVISVKNKINPNT